MDGSAVLAGFGDGNVKHILNEMIRKGYDGFLSIEPHLFDFKGFAEPRDSPKLSADGHFQDLKRSLPHITP